MDNILKNIQLEIKSFLISKGIKNPEFNLEESRNQKFGDFSTSAAMQYSKEIGVSSTELASEMVIFLQNRDIKNIKLVDFVVPGFVNFFFDNLFIKESILKILKEKSNFGKNKSLDTQKWVVEHTSPNPNKAMHLGHLRNNLVGMGIVRILKWNGAEVISDAVYNNRGIAIAKLIWGFLEFMKKDEKFTSDIDEWSSNKDGWFTPNEKGMKSDVFVTECYILGEESFKKDVDNEQIVRNLVVRWEAGDQKVWEIWEHVLEYAYDGIDKTLDRLGNHWDKIWYEHDHYKKGKKFIKKGLDKKVFKQLEDGAVLTDLSSYDIPDTILLKKDGTSLYITQDTALTSIKKEYYNADKLIWVIGPEQTLAMKQLFAICEQLGIGKIEDFTHIPYGYVGLKSEDGGFKKMSSRDGTVILIDDLIDDIKSKIKKGFIGDKESKGSDNVYEKIALAAIKFSILKSDRLQDLTFDAEQSVDMAGDSGVYILYTYTRIQSILRKSIKNSNSNVYFDLHGDFGEEENLVRSLMYFSEEVKKSKDNLSVHYIAQYLINLCSLFNSWYSKEVILDGTDKEDYKIAIAESVGILIKNGLEILGIDTVEEM